MEVTFEKIKEIYDSFPKVEEPKNLYINPIQYEIFKASLKDVPADYISPFYHMSGIKVYQDEDVEVGCFYQATDKQWQDFKDKMKELKAKMQILI